MTWFDESRLDDPATLGAFDQRLRALAESGARVRREIHDAAAAIAQAVAQGQQRPRAVVAAGPDSRLLRAVLEPWCPVPFVAWPSAGLPGWAGGLDLVVILAPVGADTDSASSAAEAVRRGCQLVVAAPPYSLVAEHAAGRWTTMLPVVTGDQLAAAVVMLDYLGQVGLGPRVDTEDVPTALDEVAVACSPHRLDLAVNPAKSLAIALADALPVLWGGSVLAARAARRVAESFRRVSGRSAIAGDAEHLLPVLRTSRSHDIFEDPFADPPAEQRPVLIILDDQHEDVLVRENADRLRAEAAARGVRVETVGTQAVTEVGRYASLVLSGTYAAEYLGVGLVED